MGEQKCRICDTVKPLSEFHFRNDNRKHRTECKSCRCSREAASRYNTTVGAIDALREKQGDRCAICGVHASEIEHTAFTQNPLVIDHSHTTNTVRGLLCPKCNIGLGQFDDNVDRLQNAINYLLAN